jgi:hypothetical protein
MVKSKTKNKNRGSAKKKEAKDPGLKIKKVILASAIAIIFALFIGFGISVFYPSPEYTDFCDRIPYREINTSEECGAAGGRWNSFESDVMAPKLEDGPAGYCDLHYYCMKSYEEVQERYDQNVFIVAVLIGLIAIIIAVAITIPSISSGLMAGGALTIIYGVLRYWRHSTDVLRFIILGVALGILIWLGYKKLNK